MACYTKKKVLFYLLNYYFVIWVYVRKKNTNTYKCQYILSFITLINSYIANENDNFCFQFYSFLSQ